VTVPELCAAVKANGEAVMPDGKPVKVTLIGPEYPLRLTATATGTFCWPG